MATVAVSKVALAVRVPVCLTCVVLADGLLVNAAAAQDAVSPPPAAVGAPMAGTAGGVTTGAGRAIVGEEYVIGPGDQLRILVRNQPDLSGSFTVRPDGRISMYLVGDLDASGKTVTQLNREIEASLAKILQEPQVTVIVDGAVGANQGIKIIGGRSPPRLVPFSEGMTALDAIIQGGGLSQYADKNAAEILRPTATGYERIPVRLGDIVERGRTDANPRLKAGDVLNVPEGFFTGLWTTQQFASFTTSYTDNRDLEPAGEREPAIIYALTPGISVQADTARVKGSATASLTGSYEQLSGNGADLQVNAVGFANTELSRDTVFLDTAASITQQALNNTQGTSDAAGNTANEETVQTYSASPYVLFDVGQYAIGEARYSLTGTVAPNNNATDYSNSIGNSVGLGLRSASEFSRFLWQASSSATKTIRFGDSDVESYQAAATPEYLVTPRFAPFTTLGYGYLSDGDTTLSGPTTIGGIRWRPSPDLTMDAGYGRQLERNAANASLSYQISGKTGLRLSYQEGVSYSQQAQVAQLSQLGVDPQTGLFVNKQTGLVYGSPLVATTLDDNLYEQQLGTATLSTVQGANTFSLIGTYRSQNSIGGNEQDFDNDDRDNNFASFADQQTWNLSLSWARAIDPLTSFNVFGGFGQGRFRNAFTQQNVNAESLDDYNANIYTGGASINRTIYENVGAFIGYSYQNNDATNREYNYKENVVFGGLQATF